MNKTFEIKCNNCGNIVTVSLGSGFLEFKDSEENNTIEFYPTGYDGEVGIRCDRCEIELEE